MKRYARIEYIYAEQWSDCSEPIDGMVHFTDEVVETALVETTQPVYIVEVGREKVPQQIRCSDWILTLNDGTQEVLSDTMFRSMFIPAENAEQFRKEISN